MSIRRMSTSTITQQERYPTMSTGTVLTYSVEAGLVGGGGSGGNFNSAGGGGGFTTLQTIDLAAKVPHSLEVGAGGATVTGATQNSNAGSDTTFSSLTADGGRGVEILSPAPAGGDGGSGGGGRSQDVAGDGGSDGSDGTAGTGSEGGAGGVGQGTTTEIFGTLYAGGGGGGSTGTAGSGGAGGGGDGSATLAQAESGDVNTGGGGGGGSRDGASVGVGGAGGSGIILFKVDTGTPVSFSAGVTDDGGTTVGSKDVYVVTQAGPTDTVTIG